MDPQIKLLHEAHWKGIAIILAKAELEQGSFLATYLFDLKTQNLEPTQIIKHQLTRN